VVVRDVAREQPAFLVFADLPGWRDFLKRIRDENAAAA